MSAGAVIERLAMQGFWISLDQPAVHARLEALSVRLGRPIGDVAEALADDARGFGAAIRRQWGTRILWYPRELQEVLESCAVAAPDLPLIDVLHLRDAEARPTIQLRQNGDTILSTGVVTDNGGPVAVSLGIGDQVQPPLSESASSDKRLSVRAADVNRSAPAPVTMSAPEKHAWPRIDAPESVPAGKPFDVVVGFRSAPQSNVAGGPVTLTVSAGVATIDVTVELSAGPGVQAPKGWSRPMRVLVADVLSAQAQFELVGLEPTDRDRPFLTMLEVRYVLDGTVCGTAARPLVIVHSGDAGPPPTSGEAWLVPPGAASPVTFVGDEQAPDLTIEISKPDRNASSGQYVGRLYSPHALESARGPFPMDLGQDAKTFAKAIVEEVRLFATSELLDNTLEGIGRLVAQRLPAPMFDALREVTAKIAPAVPAVLIVSAEPYVPWELAWIEPPLDAARPPYLGAQALVGRWLRDGDAPATTGGASAMPRPAPHPIARLAVRNMAVMAAWYKTESGLRRLPKAEDEARAIATGWQALALAASAQSMRQLLNASLERGFERIGGVEAVHFAGHGDFDPGRPDGSALFLEDGTALRSTLFRAAKYGGEHQPLMFLNACMLGIGGELLGDMAGFPGNSLRGGFGGVLAALWEIDDAVAHDTALEFWRRALPAPPAQGEPVGAILRDMRAKYVAGAVPAPVSTYLAYVYYGHPRLTLERAGA